MEPLLFFYHILTFLQTHQTPKYILRIASLYAYNLPEIQAYRNRFSANGAYYSKSNDVTE